MTDVATPPDDPSRTRGGGRGLLVATVAPALVLAGLGLTHPTDLTSASAPWWTTLHLLLLPVFPLLGLALGLLLRGERGPVAWFARVAAFGYAAFYTALDVLAGIGTGGLVQRGTDPEAPEVDSLFALGNELAEVGVWCFVLAAAATAFVIVGRAGQRALPGAVLLVAAAVVFTSSHIYWPVGGLAMLAMAAAFALLALAPPRPDPVPAAASEP